MQSVPQGITDHCSRRSKTQDTVSTAAASRTPLKAPWLGVWHHSQPLRSYFGLETIQDGYVIQSCAVCIIKQSNPVNLCSASQSGAVSPTQRCNRLCSAVQCNQFQRGQFAPNRCSGQCCALGMQQARQSGYRAATTTAIAVQLTCQGDAVQSQMQGKGSSQLKPTPQGTIVLSFYKTAICSQFHKAVRSRSSTAS